jgi:hypothetical protein
MTTFEQLLTVLRPRVRDPVWLGEPGPDASEWSARLNTRLHREHVVAVTRQ